MNKIDQLKHNIYLQLPSASTGAGGKGGASKSFSAPSSAYLAGEKENFLEVAAKIMAERPRPIPAWICRESIVCVFCFVLFWWGDAAIDGCEVFLREVVVAPPPRLGGKMN